MTSTAANDGARIVSVAGETPYDVVIGHHLLGELPRLLGDRVQRVLVIHAAALATSADAIRDDLLAHGYEALLAEVPDAEAAKTAQVAAFCWQVLGQADFTRSDAIVSLGGGATTDLAGFVASTWLRGIRVVHVPTTLLAMVDAAVGGKTGINTVEGKNLVGTFYAPAGVLCDLASLETMPRFDYVAGLGEVSVCVAYKLDGKELDEPPTDPEDLVRAQPVYTKIAGWDKLPSDARDITDLPAPARAYVETIDAGGQRRALLRPILAENAGQRRIEPVWVVTRHRAGRLGQKAGDGEGLRLRIGQRAGTMRLLRRRLGDALDRPGPGVVQRRQDDRARALVADFPG